MVIHEARDFERFRQQLYFTAWEGGHEVTVALDLSDTPDDDISRLMAMIISIRAERGEAATKKVIDQFRKV